MKKGFGYYLIMVFLSAIGLVLAFVVLQFALFFVITREKPKAYTFPDSKCKTYFVDEIIIPNPVIVCNDNKRYVTIYDSIPRPLYQQDLEHNPLFVELGKIGATDNSYLFKKRNKALLRKYNNRQLREFPDEDEMIYPTLKTTQDSIVIKGFHYAPEKFLVVMEKSVDCYIYKVLPLYKKSDCKDLEKVILNKLKKEREDYLNTFIDQSYWGSL